jgi:HK97 family phage major capsid protein
MEVTMEQVGRAVDELRKEVEKKSIDGAKLERLNIVLDAYEKKNQEITMAQEAAKSAEESVKELKRELETKGVEAGKIREQVDHLEMIIAKQSTGSPNFREAPEYKSFETYIRHGVGGPNGVELKALRTDSATEGGVLVTTEMEGQILKKITEIDPIRSISRVRPMASKTLSVSIRNSIPVAVYEGEAETGTDSQSAYSAETITPFRLTHSTAITRDMLMDSAFDMEVEIINDAAEAFAFGEGNGFVVGTGFKMPAGFLVDAAVVAAKRTSTAGSGVLGADDPILLQGDLKVGYEGTFVLNRRTMANLRTKKSTDGVYLWAPGLNGPAAATLSGSPYILANSMPDIAASSYPLAFGAFRIGYMIVDRTAVEIIRDDYTLKKTAQVEFTIHRWNTGKVVLPEAIKVLQLQA